MKTRGEIKIIIISDMSFIIRKSRNAAKFFPIKAKEDIKINCFVNGKTIQKISLSSY